MNELNMKGAHTMTHTTDEFIEQMTELNETELDILIAFTNLRILEYTVAGNHGLKELYIQLNVKLTDMKGALNK